MYVMGKWITLKKLRQQLFMGIANLPMPGHKWRPLFVKMGGVIVYDYKKVFIGRNVSFDAVNPELIKIKSGVRITAGSSILTHYFNPSTGHYDKGIVLIEEDAFIGTKTIITKPITIGKRAVVGAGSVVTKNIPADEIWAGNPARFIRKRL